MVLCLSLYLLTHQAAYLLPVHLTRDQCLEVEDKAGPRGPARGDRAPQALLLDEREVSEGHRPGDSILRPFPLGVPERILACRTRVSKPYNHPLEKWILRKNVLIQ